MFSLTIRKGGFRVRQLIKRPVKIVSSEEAYQAHLQARHPKKAKKTHFSTMGYALSSRGVFRVPLLPTGWST